VPDAILEPRGETTRLGSFEVVRKLARGGMAEIFLARTRGPSGFEKLVVLKKILPAYAGKRRFVQLFLDEARLAASLDHPGIAQVYDIGTVDGSYFFTMEYLHGQDVRTIMHRTWRLGEPLPIEHAVQIARHVASALHFAHDKQQRDGTHLGIVHRDVSPSNIIVTYDGATKLLDFGVAKTTASSVKTRTGALKGKVAYMSPEQAKGAPVDRRSDIFSLGIVLWEMVTTQRLYRADNDLATLQLILHQPPRPPSELRPDCPPELERIVLRALAGDPGARYATAEQLVTDLDELAREHKLKQSTNALAATVSRLFAPELAAWREAEAAGVALGDHLHRAGDMTTPVSDSDLIDHGALLDSVDEPDEFLDEGSGDDEAQPEPDDDDDDELTEHAATIVPPLPPLVPELARTTMRSPTMTSELASEQDTIAVPPLDHDRLDAASSAPFETATPEEPTRSAGFAMAGPRDPAGAAFPAMAEPGPPSSVAYPEAPHPGAAFAVPPWQSGQPASLVPVEPPRSWAIVELPAIDPELFARQRRLVLRVAGGVVGLILVIAIMLGRC